MKRNKAKKIGILCFLLFLFGLPIISSTIDKSFSNGVAGLKLSTSANFYAISESDLTTRWIMQGAEISAFEDFHDNISGSNWDLFGVSERSINVSYIPTDDSYTTEVWSGTNYGNDDYLYTTDTWGGGIIYTFIGQDNPFLFLNYSANSDLYLFVRELLGGNAKVNISETGDFDEGTITWNNQPGFGDFIMQTNALSGGNGYNFDIGAPTEYYLINLADPLGVNRLPKFGSSEATNSIHKPKITHYLTKNYQGSGYMYMQTNTTETLSLKSTDYGTHYNLSSGDYFEVDFQTSSDSQINLILLKDGGVNKTLILSPSGNTNFNNQTAKISVDEFVEFDQLKISSTFENLDNVKVYDIKTYKYTITGDYADFYVGSRRTHSVNLTSDTYNLRIFEEGDEKINENVTIGTSDYFYVYTPIKTKYCRLTLFNTENIHLEFTDYHIKVNRSLNGIYNEFWLLDSLFSVDKETYVYISVYDRFDTLIDTFERLASDYIDLELEVYSLQIKNLMTQKTTIDINSTYTYPLLSGDSIYFILSVAHYQIGYYDTNDVYKQFTIYLNSNQAYELNRSRICFLSYANQQGTHLYFENYKTYLNGSLIYENVFYREIGDNVGIEIKDRYGISIKNETYTVISGDNYIPITLIMYSLKVMNQQEIFNWINITRDPVYYESSMYWSEWIAPEEIIEFKMFAGYYKINLTDNENSGSSYYSYTLSGDDILLISSGNVISNVIINIANVNATIGNQITSVYIDISNQNSQINNTIINIEINLSNVNSTLGNMLTAINLNITNVANNISNLYTFTNNSFINLDNNINNSFIYIENNIIAINQSISNLVIGVNNELSLINGTISTLMIGLSNDLDLVNVSMSTLLIDLDTRLNLVNSSISTLIADFGTDLLLINTSINTAIFSVNTTLNLIGSNITNNYILLNNSIDLTNVNINDSRIAMINNLLLVNSTMSTLISQVYSSVYLVNNSIYTAVVDVGTSLLLVNNSISGNLTIIFQQNEFLTELYQMTMFSDMLNWTDIGLNTSLLTSQIDVWTFINNYINQSIEVHLRYQDLIENITISADDLVEQWLPAEDVEYNLWSAADEEYLDNWTALPENKTVSFGFFEMEVPIEPEPLLPPDMVDFLVLLVMFIPIIMIIGGSVLYFKIRSGANKTVRGLYEEHLAFRSLKQIWRGINKNKIVIALIFILVIICIILYIL